jgi:hypothetical protein
VATTTQDLQRLLEDAWDNAPDGALTLREELRRNERAIGVLIAQGSLSSVSKNSSSQSYAFGQGQLTTAEMARAWRVLINLFDRSQSIILAASLTNDDDTIYAEMKARLVPVYSTRPNLHTLREACA